MPHKASSSGETPRPPRQLRLRLLCLLNWHKPRGHRANWNGSHYISRCEHCNQSIKRLSRGKWVLDRERQSRRDKRRKERKLQRSGLAPEPAE